MPSDIVGASPLPSQEERSKILERAGLILAQARALAYELDRERRSPVGYLLASRIVPPNVEDFFAVRFPEVTDPPELMPAWPGSRAPSAALPSSPG